MTHWCIFGSETLHVPVTLFDSLEMGHRFISVCGKRASHSPAKTPSKTLSLKSWIGCEWKTTLCRRTCFSSWTKWNTFHRNELDMDHTAVQWFELLSESRLRLWVECLGLYCVGSTCSRCVCVLRFPDEQHAMNWPRTRVWRSICGSAIGFWPPLLNDGQDCLLLPHWSAGKAAIESCWLTGWMWWTPDAGKNSSKNDESLTEKTQQKNLISIIECVTCVLPCVTCPQKLSPLLTFHLYQVCGPVWTAHDSCLFVV